MSAPRRVLATLLVVGALALQADTALAGDGVPLQLQAQLVSKLGSFDRNFAARAGGVARVLVIQKAENTESLRVAGNISKALSGLHDMGGVAFRVDVETFASAASLAERCRSQKISVLYFSTGLEAEMPSTGKALIGVDVLTVGATASFAEYGTVVAFDLEEGRPKLVINLARAKAQNISFKAELLKLARIVG